MDMKHLAQLLQQQGYEDQHILQLIAALLEEEQHQKRLLLEIKELIHKNGKAT